MPYNSSGYGDYYRGDYYRGDYYRGDPFIHKKLFRTVKRIGGAVLGATPVGRALGFGGGTRQPQPSFQPITGLIPLADIPTNEGAPTGMLDEFRTAAARRGRAEGVSCLQPGTKPGHLNKSDYFVQTPGNPTVGQLIERGTTCVVNRRMNAANPRALRKAIRRTRGAVKLLRGAAQACGYTVISKSALASRPKKKK